MTLAIAPGEPRVRSGNRNTVAGAVVAGPISDDSSDLASSNAS